MNQIAHFKKELKDLLDSHQVLLSLSCYDSEANLRFHVKDENGSIHSENATTDNFLGDCYESLHDETIINDLL